MESAWHSLVVRLARAPNNLPLLNNKRSLLNNNLPLSENSRALFHANPRSH